MNTKDYTKEQLEEMLHSDDWQQRHKVATLGYRLDILVDDENWLVREAVAKQEYGLDKLINDKDKCVREAAKRGKDLKKFRLKRK